MILAAALNLDMLLPDKLLSDMLSLCSVQPAIAECDIIDKTLFGSAGEYSKDGYRACSTVQVMLHSVSL